MLLSSISLSLSAFCSLTHSSLSLDCSTSMPFPMKIQPIDADSEPVRIVDSAAKPVLKSRLRRLFDRQFPSVLKISSSKKPPASAGGDFNKDGGEFEPSSVCLAKMVQNYIEESNEKQQPMKCGRNRCNCFHGNNNDSSDDELDFFFGGDSTASNGSFGGDASDILKSLVPCVSVANADVCSSKISPNNTVPILTILEYSDAAFVTLCRSLNSPGPQPPFSPALDRSGIKPRH